MDVSLAKEFYFREFEGKVQQDTRLGVYVALLSAVGGVLAYLIRNAWSGQTNWFLGSLVLSFVSVVLYFLAIVWVLRATVGVIYEKLPSPNTLLAYWQDLSLYYQENPEITGSASSDFDDFLVRHFSSAATRNANNNFIRSARYYRAALFLLWVVIFSALAGLCLFLNQFLIGFCSKGV